MERKLATVVFVDLVGSTELVAGSDPEVVRRRVSRFFERVSHCITTHGGIVEKFAGDAVMAAFGVPQAHEDDAERGVRAALSILEEVHALGLEARVGIEAGEVVVDDSDSTFATGEAVNVAARLQQAAAPGEVLMGPTAHRLTAGRVLAEEREPVTLRGFEEPVPVWRPNGIVDGGGRTVSVDAPFVGRETELELLENSLARSVRDCRTLLFTIYGEAGVGKSRLTREFLAGVEGATILSGRCLPYGEGVTYWPLAEMVKVAAGISDDDPVQEAVGKLRACCGDDAVADLLGLAAGVLEAVETERGQQEIAWAAREWAAQLAAAQPLILVFEDIHWAEEPLLALIEHLAERVREEPLLILCLARPELLDVHPGWGGGRLRATAIELEPLAPAESEALVDALLAEHSLSPKMRHLLLEKTEGNPLFVEETIRMLVEEGGDGPVRGIPDTLQALIAARIDFLPPDCKLLLQRAAVAGRIFWAGAFSELAPELDDPGSALEGLIQRDFVTRESRTTIKGERAFRFKHVLIRDVAYGGLTKGMRADLHARFARWLAEHVGGELLEIRAYHLDQAALLHAELDGAVPAELAREAAAVLEQAGRRAVAREANRSARKLFRRAVELEPTLERRFQAARAASRLDDLPTVAVEMEVVRAAAAEAGDRAIEGRASTVLAEVALLRDADLPRGRELVEGALELLQDAEPEDRFHALTTRARIDWWLGNLAADEKYLRRALAVAQESGRRDLEATATEELASVAFFRRDFDESSRLVERSLELLAGSSHRVARAWALVQRGRLALAHGRLNDAEVDLRDAIELFDEAGAAWGLARASEIAGSVAWRSGDTATADRWFREAIRLLTPIEDRGALCESQRQLAQLYVELGRVDEAEALALQARKTVGPHDVISRATTRMALGIVRAAQGRDEEAESLLHEAVDVIGNTGMLYAREAAMAAMAGFLRERGRVAEAEAYELEAAALRPDEAASSTARIA